MSLPLFRRPFAPGRLPDDLLKVHTARSTPLTKAMLAHRPGSVNETTAQNTVVMALSWL
jgi:hypothetical protein